MTVETPPIPLDNLPSDAFLTVAYRYHRIAIAEGDLAGAHSLLVKIRQKFGINDETDTDDTSDVESSSESSYNSIDEHESTGEAALVNSFSGHWLFQDDSDSASTESIDGDSSISSSNNSSHI